MKVIIVAVHSPSHSSLLLPWLLMPGFPLYSSSPSPEFSQTQAHWVNMPSSYKMILCQLLLPPASILSALYIFSNVSLFGIRWLQMGASATLVSSKYIQGDFRGLTGLTFLYIYVTYKYITSYLYLYRAGRSVCKILWRTSVVQLQDSALHQGGC